MENSMEIPQKITNRIAKDWAILLLYESRVLRYLHTLVHNSIIHHSQQAEATKISINR